MALPKIKQPIFTHYLKGIEKEVEFRPFTVAEQKILLLAKEGKDKEQMLKSIEQILNNCILTKDLDVMDLPYFDIEDIFIRIRAKSVGEEIDAKYVYEYKDEETGDIKKDEIIIKINTDDIEVKENDSNKIIILQEKPQKIGVKMKYPTLKMYRNTNSKEESEQSEVILQCIDCIFQDDEVFTDFSREELEEFIDDLDANNFKKFKDFFDNMPSIHHEIDVTMPKTKEKIKLTFNNLSDFFF